MGPAVIPDGKILYRFKVGGPTERELARQAMNEALIVPGVSSAIEDYLRATADDPPEPPEIIHHQIDDELQTGDSRGLGGGMSIREPWKRD